MPNRWVEFVKDCAARNNLSYGCAITNADCRAEYAAIKASAPLKMKKPRKSKKMLDNEEFGVTMDQIPQTPRQVSLPMPMPYRTPVYQDLEEAVPSEYPLMKNIMIPQRLEIGVPSEEPVMKNVFIPTNPMRQLIPVYEFKQPREERQVPPFYVLKIDDKKYLAFKKDYRDESKRNIKIFDFDRAQEGEVVKIGKYLKDIGDVLLD